MELNAKNIKRRFKELEMSIDVLADAQEELETAKRAHKFAIANHSVQGKIYDPAKHGKTAPQREAHADHVLSHHLARIDASERAYSRAKNRYDKAQLRLSEMRNLMRLERLHIERLKIENDKNNTVMLLPDLVDMAEDYHAGNS